MGRLKRSPLWDDPRVQPPYGTVEVNRAHPLATGYQNSLLFNDGLRAPQWLIQRPTATVEGAPVAKVAAPGRGVRFDGSTALVYWPFSYLPGGGFPSGWSAHLIFSEWTDTDPDKAFCMLGGSSSSTTPLVQIDTGGVAAGQVGFFYRDDAGNGVRATVTGLGLNDGKPHSVTAVLHSAAAGGLRCYVDGGNKVTGSTASFGGVTVNQTAVGGHRRIASGFQIPATLHLLHILNTALSDSDARWLHAEPYAMLQPTIRRRYFVPSAVGVSIPILIHAQRQMRGGFVNA